MQAVLVAIQDILNFPQWGRGVYCVWRRNFLYFRQTLAMSFFWILLEPLIYLVGIGYGLGSLVNDINGVSYIEFFAPGFICASSMMVSFYESTYSTFTKFFRQKTFQTILLTPLSASEILIGEIAWAASKGFFSAIAIAIVGLQMGLFQSIMLLPVLVVVFLNCWLVAAFGQLMCGYAKNYDWFIYSLTGFIMPMYMFSGAFFPISQLPVLVQKFVYALPLTHAVSASRDLISGNINSMIFANICFLFLVGFLLTNWAVAKMTKKLVV